MKKLISLILVLVGVFSLAGCKVNKYKNGTFTDFEEATPGVDQEHGDLTWVTVVVKDGKIKSYYIDTLQWSNCAYKTESKK